MSNKIDDGGPAFPVAENHKIAADYEWTCGMSLRDYLAAKALAGMMADNQNVHREGAFDDWAKSNAEQCYTIADAMLVARKERP